MKQVNAVIIISQTSTHICLHVTVLYIDHNLNPVMIIYKKTNRTWKQIEKKPEASSCISMNIHPSNINISIFNVTEMRRT
jgi:hypothetical protein